MHAQLRDKPSSSQIILRVIFSDFTLSLISLILSSFSGTIFGTLTRCLGSIYSILLYIPCISVPVSERRESKAVRRQRRKKSHDVFPTLLELLSQVKGMFPSLQVLGSCQPLLPLLPQDCMGATAQKNGGKRKRKEK